MYQGVPNQPQTYTSGYYQPNTNPYTGQYQRMTVPEIYSTNPSMSYIKGRPVLSLEEAKASQIDLDGSLHVFTDIGNKKIYTKQLNLDGTATLKTYILQEEENKTSSQTEEYVTKAEFNQALAQIQSMFTKKDEEKKPVSLNF